MPPGAPGSGGVFGASASVKGKRQAETAGGIPSKAPSLLAHRKCECLWFLTPPVSDSARVMSLKAYADG